MAETTGDWQHRLSDGLVSMLTQAGNGRTSEEDTSIDCDRFISELQQLIHATIREVSPTPISDRAAVAAYRKSGDVVWTHATGPAIGRTIEAVVRESGVWLVDKTSREQLARMVGDASLKEIEDACRFVAVGMTVARKPRPNNREVGEEVFRHKDVDCVATQRDNSVDLESEDGSILYLQLDRDEELPVIEAAGNGVASGIAVGKKHATERALDIIRAQHRQVLQHIGA